MFFLSPVLNVSTMHRLCKTDVDVFPLHLSLLWLCLSLMQALRDEIDKRLLQLSGASGDRDQGHSVPHGLPEVLPTGELLAEVLKELLEDAAEYEERVWVQRPPQERVQ